jgi:hypothetical protein
VETHPACIPRAVAGIDPPELPRRDRFGTLGSCRRAVPAAEASAEAPAWRINLGQGHAAGPQA